MSINKVLVYPRLIVKNTIGRFTSKDIAIISIIDYPHDTLLTKEFIELNHLMEVPQITIWFNDITYKDYHRMSRHVKESLRLFTESDAKLILDFVKTVNEIPRVMTLIIHCEAGVSRSGAVGLWANRYLNLDESLFRRHNSNIYPNSYILKLLSDYSGITKKYLIWWNEHISPDKIF
jgi:predicted protein tyrosine phosphatase